jgi:ABC-type transporter Mla MlaB component
VIAAAQRLARISPGDHPTYQWDAALDAGARTIRLYGRLGERELSRVLDAIVERARSPRDIVRVDLSGVIHVDFRAVAGFLSGLGRLRDRSASVWIVGASPYVQQLMDVSGQGSLWRALSPDVGPAANATRLGGDDLRAAERRALRAGAWN